MKYLQLLALLLVSSVIFLSSCKEPVKAPKEEVLQPLNLEQWANQPSAATQNPAAAGAEAAQNAVGVWHYTCSQGCVGGAGMAGNCNTCGGLLAHNAGYHANTVNSSTSSTPFATLNAPAGVEPSQNAAGVWHYSCGKGCAGGSGSAGNCNACGTVLAHNAAYHS
jgi:hypothetical protein